MKIFYWSVILCIAAGSAFGQSKRMTWTVDGVKREAIVYPPSAKTANGGAPLVLAFHGHGDDAINFQGVDLQSQWREAVIVYPQGLPSARDGASGWQVEKGQDGDRDLKLVDAMLAALRREYKIDDARIYSTGFSNGANLTYLLWAERAEVFAAFAPVAARVRPSQHFAIPRPVFHTGGTADRQILFTDQKDAIEAARRANGAMGKGEPCGPQCMLYSPETKAGAPVMTFIHSGGHEYPERTSRMIVDFFRKHALRGTLLHDDN